MNYNNPRDWLADRKDLYVKNIVKDFFTSYDFFKDIDKKFQEEGLSYHGMDQWVGTQGKRGILWLLKDLTHHLWKNEDPDTEPDKFMFDWMIGTLFHEAMKLKENLYIIANYRPSYNTMYSNHDDANNNSEKCPVFFNEISDEITRNLKRIRCLYSKAINILHAILASEKDNALLIRFILDEKNRAPEKWGSQHGLGALLKKLFPDSMDEAYCIAGESYLEGSWYTEAKEAFEEALKINPECMEARSALRILEKRLNEIAILLDREYSINGI